MHRRAEAVAPPTKEHIYIAVVLHTPRASPLSFFLSAPEAIEGQVAVAAPPIHRA